MLELFGLVKFITDLKINLQVLRQFAESHRVPNKVKNKRVKFTKQEDTFNLTKEFTRVRSTNDSLN